MEILLVLFFLVFCFIGLAFAFVVNALCCFIPPIAEFVLLLIISCIIGAIPLICGLMTPKKKALGIIGGVVCFATSFILGFLGLPILSGLLLFLAPALNFLPLGMFLVLGVQFLAIFLSVVEWFIAALGLIVSLVACLIFSILIAKKEKAKVIPAPQSRQNPVVTE